MRIWDVSPGYLSRQSLLGEHRELHGLHSILVHDKTGYARHPETLRWVGCVTGLARRHAQLVAEMRLRGYADRTPVDCATVSRWPLTFVTPPAQQLALLAAKYAGTTFGRIALPRNAQELWAHHKYSVLARDQALYRSLGRRVARMKRGSPVAALAEELTLLLRQSPPRASFVNAVEHMWGHVSSAASDDERQAARRSLPELYRVTRAIATRTREPYLMASTALGELAVFARCD